jgi:hypothetical protein
MKKILLYSIVLAGSVITTTSCNDYLDTSSPSVVDAEFVFSNVETAQAAMQGAYETWRGANNSYAFGDGLFYATDMAGSDIERHPEKFANQPGRHYVECLYQNGTYAGNYGLLSYQAEATLKSSNLYTEMYSVITKCNAIINAMKEATAYKNAVTANTTTELTQLYGEAVAMRAASYEWLIRYYGDVPYKTVNGVASVGLSPRDSIYDSCIADLIAAEPLMYRVGETSTATKNVMSRTFVEGLIGRMCLDAAGYQTRRTDLGDNFYKDGKGNVLSWEQKGTNNNDCFYARRSDWKTLYSTAKTYFKMVIDNPGSATFHETDTRSAGKAGQVYDNPYQYFFQQMNDLEYADESIYEYAMSQGQSDARPYALGRPSNGGSSNNYPCKDYGQGRINPAFYYGMFSPNDKRRDVSATITGSTGKGFETLIPFVPNSKSSGGGISCNKWDENRMATPYVAKQRNSGINGPFMRMSEIYLGYAEACAIVDGEGSADARTYLDKIRNRAFGSATAANTSAFITSCGSLFKAVIQERGFEFAGEGDRRWTLIRTGLLPDAVKNIKDMTAAMIDGLKANGSYTFANGNTISYFVWTKAVDAKADYGYRLTTQCPAGKENDAVLFPGWRGQNDAWESFGCTYANTKTNLAIRGVFDNYVPSSVTVTITNAKKEKTVTTMTDVTNLSLSELIDETLKTSGNTIVITDQDGYTLNNWGKDIVKNADEYNKYLFYDYDYSKAPIYLWPFTPNILSTGGFTNGYGFAQK